MFVSNPRNAPVRRSVMVPNVVRTVAVVIVGNANPGRPVRMGCVYASPIAPTVCVGITAVVVRAGIVVWARSASMVNVPVPRIVASKNAVTTAVVVPVGSVPRAPSATSMESAKGMVQSM